MKKFNDQRALVLQAIIDFPRHTAKEIGSILRECGHKIEDSSVTGRVAELKDLEHVVVVGTKRCSCTGSSASALEVVSEANQHLIVKKEPKEVVHSTSDGDKLLGYLLDRDISRLDKLKTLDILKAKLLISNSFHLEEVMKGNNNG